MNMSRVAVLLALLCTVHSCQAGVRVGSPTSAGHARQHTGTGSSMPAPSASGSAALGTGTSKAGGGPPLLTGKLKSDNNVAKPWLVTLDVTSVAAKPISVLTWNTPFEKTIAKKQTFFGLQARLFKKDSSGKKTLVKSRAAHSSREWDFVHVDSIMSFNKDETKSTPFDIQRAYNLEVGDYILEPMIQFMIVSVDPKKPDLPFLDATPLTQKKKPKLTRSQSAPNVLSEPLAPEVVLKSADPEKYRAVTLVKAETVAFGSHEFSVKTAVEAAIPKDTDEYTKAKTSGSTSFLQLGRRQASRQGARQPTDLITFGKKCDEEDKQWMHKSVDGALGHAENAMHFMQHYNAGKLDEEAKCNMLMKNWFGTYKADHGPEIEAIYTKATKHLETKETALNCYDTECTSDTYAYVYPDRHIIYLCHRYYKKVKERTDTILHEVTHFKTVGDTEDYEYGKENCKELAWDKPFKAANNADNYAYFAAEAWDLRQQCGVNRRS